MAKYAHVEDGQITGVYDTLPSNWRNVSNFSALAEDANTLQELGWVEVKTVEPNYNEYQQRLGNPIHSIVDGEVVETIEVIDLPAYEPVQPIYITELDIVADNIRRHNEAVQVIRAERDRLLAASDFTQLPDVIEANGAELTKAYQDYRQALRDFPTQYVEDPLFFDANFIQFPEMPKPTPAVSNIPSEEVSPPSDSQVDLPPSDPEPEAPTTDAFGNPIGNTETPTEPPVETPPVDTPPEESTNTQPDNGTV